MRYSLSLSLAAVIGTLAVFLLEAGPSFTAGQRFYDDDPIARAPETQDASGAKEYDIDLAADLMLNTFSQRGDGRFGIRAENLNTIDEVPDSSWFTNRVGARAVTIDELMKGPNTIDGPAPGRWTVIRPKTAGFAPGFTVEDSRGDVWFLTFDVKSMPNAATGAIAVAVRLFWGLGYFQVESFLSSVKVADLAVSEKAVIRRSDGRARPMTMDDVERVLDRAAHGEDGSYRVLAARSVPGRVLGGFRYYGTRPDDPNDLVPHEHRRELRALQVFGAWINLVDLKAGNTLDTVIEENGRSIVRHYLQDVGSTFGTGALGPREWDEGWEYLYDGPPLRKRLVTLGFYIRPWQTANYIDLPEIGRFEGDAFDPEAWRSRVPASAALYARADDTFWAALRVAAFSDEMIRAAAGAARYTDPRATSLLGDVLIKRRNKIARAYLPKVNPLVRFALDGSGTLTFENAAVLRGVATAPSDGYRTVWSRFDNATGQATAIGAPIDAREPRVTASADVLRQAGDLVEVAVTAIDPGRPSWARPVRVYFKRQGDAWKLVGLERLPATTPR
jgi:hypothetical protein